MKNHRFNKLAHIFGLLLIAGTGCGGGCGGCELSPLPGGALPADQTLEGGAQLRISPQGFDKLTSLVPAALNDSLEDGFCIRGQEIVDAGFLGNAGACQSASITQCDNGTTGCQVDVIIDQFDLSVPDPGTLSVNVQFDVLSSLWIGADTILGDAGCFMDVTANNAKVEVDLAFDIDPSTGELEILVEDLENFSLNVDVDGCSAVGDIIDGLFDVLDAIVDLLTDDLLDFLDPLINPLLTDLLNSLLPDPLGIEGLADLSGSVGGFAPETNVGLEMRFVPGGYVFLENQGMSLGFITGFNADEDPATRDAELDSEPALCVPPIPAPDFAAPPASLSNSSRGNFNLLPAGLFRGMPSDDPSADIVFGASESFLDLTGHHIVTSGTMCLGIGTETIDQLNLGVFGLLAPSLSELGDVTSPVLLVTRPQKAVDFTIGTGSESDPSLTISLDNFEVDVYAFLYERYVRGFTMSLTLDAGLNLEFTTDDEGNPAILPVLSGLSSSDISVEILNDEFVRETAAELEAIIPSLFDLIVPLLSGLDPVAMPDIAGFTLTSLLTDKVTTSEDDFLAIRANLGVSPMTRELLGKHFPVTMDTMAAFDNVELPARSQGQAHLLSVDVPAPAAIRTALRDENVAGTPTVSIAVDTLDQRGRSLEWTYRINGGMWRSFRQGPTLHIADGAFVFQGKYKIDLASRVVGDYRTLSQDTISIPVVIDSAAPRINIADIYLENEVLYVSATDIVSPAESIEFAFSTADADSPQSAWGAGEISREFVQQLIGDKGMLRVWARDEIGNTDSQDADVTGIIYFHGGNDDGGCNCSVGGTQDSEDGGAAGLLLLAGLFWFAMRRRRRRLRFNWGIRPMQLAACVLFVLGAGLLPACSCSSDPSAGACATDQECLEFCPDDKIGICIADTGECICSDDIEFGRVGQYSDMSVAPGGDIWVSAYNSTHGDLMVARQADPGRIPQENWSYVDGVPDIMPQLPNSNIRGGIRDAGDDVGLYTSVAAVSNQLAMVSYFDRTSLSLRFTANYEGEWSKHVVDAGNGTADDANGTFKVAGQYNSITLDNEDRPGIAYFVQLGQGGGNLTTELRFAQAKTTTPRSASDWQLFIVDTMDLVGGEKNFLDIPEGLGLFINSARNLDGEVSIAYYDRFNGTLKLARFDNEGGGFNEASVVAGGEQDGGQQDAGWYPGIAIDEEDVVHLSYVNASNDNLYYINTTDLVSEVVDDGYRIVGTTEEGLPKPEFHFVGDDSSVALTPAGVVVVYQDATSHELRIADKEDEGGWFHEAIAGEETPFEGAYGFYADAEWDGADLAMSSWVVDQPGDEVWVEIFRRTIIVE